MSLVRGEFPHPDSVKLNELLGGKEASRILHTQYSNQPLQELPPMELWYLAHPVSGDGNYSEADNIAHAQKIQAIMWEAGLKVVNTWHSFVSHYGSAADDPERLEAFLMLDKAAILALGGVILSGHKMSSGMEVEFRFSQLHKLRIGNLIGIPDNILGEAVKDYMVQPIESTLTKF